MTVLSVRSDFTQSVSLDCEALPSIASPLPGVERRLLDRIGGERARATSIVRYAPQSAFSAHDHPGGEEFLVISGIFSDGEGDYGPGTYVRNPVGSRHAPWSESGCTIFVKLLQMAPEDRTRLVIDTNAFDMPIGNDGLAMMTLYRFRGEHVAFGRLEAGAHANIPFPEGGEFLMLAGVARHDSNNLRPLHWLRQAAGTSLDISAESEIRFWIKHGLPRIDGFEEMIT